MANTITFEEFDVNESDGISLRWTKACHKIEKYITRLRLTNDKEKINELFLHGGYDLEQIYIQYKDEDDTLENVIKKITDHFNPSGNVHLNRYKFREIQQQEGESFDEYTGRVKTSAKLCSFTDSDAECASQIIQRCRSATLKDKALSAKTTPTLKELIEMGRLDERIQAQIKEIPSAAASSINQIKTENRQHQSRNNNNSRQHHQSVRFSQQYSQARQASSFNSKCPNCAYDLPHKTRDGACPAKGRECSNCGKLNHFAQACRQRKPEISGSFNRARHSKRTIYALKHDEPTSDNEYSEHSHNVWSVTNVIGKVKSYINSIFMPTIVLMMLQSMVEFSVDTGSQVDLMDMNTFKKLT